MAGICNAQFMFGFAFLKNLFDFFVAQFIVKSRVEKGLKQIKDFEAGISENPFFVEMPMGLPSTR